MRIDSIAAPDRTFQISNDIEAGLWTAIGLCFVIAIARSARFRGRRLLTATVFVLFGVSDAVEAQTGAWYQPFWLLAWKGVCVIALILLIWREIRTKQQDVKI